MISLEEVYLVIERLRKENLQLLEENKILKDALKAQEKKKEE
jgi:hypothetical protein